MAVAGSIPSLDVAYSTVNTFRLVPGDGSDISARDITFVPAPVHGHGPAPLYGRITAFGFTSQRWITGAAPLGRNDAMYSFDPPTVLLMTFPATAGVPVP